MERRQRTFEEKLNTWLQISAIIVAGIWAASTFFYQQVKVPNSAPINVTMNLQLKKVSTHPRKDPLEWIEMRVTATNPSSRTIYLLPNVWSVSGYKVNTFNEDFEAFSKRVNIAMNSQGELYAERNLTRTDSAVVAAGNLFDDDSINPGESLMRTIVLQVPLGQYEAIEASTEMPFATRDLSPQKDGPMLVWTLDSAGFRRQLYRLDPAGKRIAVSGEDEFKLMRALDVHESSSSSAISLLD